MTENILQVAIIGASSYTGAELARLLAAHPRAGLQIATASGERAGVPLSNLFPHLRGICDIETSELDVAKLARECDFVFIALPHGKSLEVAPQLLEAGVKVCDLGADFRLRCTKQYSQWYKLEHSAPETLAQAVYGLPEWNREKIKSARLVANPGCYPTSAILPLAPFVEKKLIKPESIIVDTASGTSGAGRASFGLGMHFPELSNDFKAYNVASHRHTPEIEQGLKDAGGEDVRISFTAHLLPIVRGILSTCYADWTKDLTTDDALQVLRDKYDGEPFVRVLPRGELPQIKYVAGSNFCDIGAVADERTRRLILVCAEDNLVKGASGQAVQNMNLMSDFPETMGLQGAPLFP